MTESMGANERTGFEIAVIGMAGRFPGAGNINRFWENLKNGVESITFFSDGELEEDGVPVELLRNTNYVKARACLDDTQYFDSPFFNYTPKESGVMDPQLRLYHEYTWTALEDAGYDPGTYRGRIGVYAGAYPGISWVSTTLKGARDSSEQYDVSVLNNVSGYGTRISYKLGLRGPSLSLQTACSTSLVAVHMACRGLINLECDIGLAGGVSISGPQKSGYLYQEGMILSQQSLCYFVPTILVQKGNPRNIHSLQDLLKEGIKLGLGDAKACAIGRKTEQIFTKNGIAWADVEKNIAFQSLTVNELGMQIQTSSLDAVIVWDAIARYYSKYGSEVPIPVEQNVISTVNIGVLSFTPNHPLAEEFVKFAASARGKDIFQEHNYRTDPPQ